MKKIFLILSMAVVLSSVAFADDGGSYNTENAEIDVVELYSVEDIVINELLRSDDPENHAVAWEYLKYRAEEYGLPPTEENLSRLAQAVLDQFKHSETETQTEANGTEAEQKCELPEHQIPSAPELKNIMPNSYQKLTRLSEREEKAFLSDTAVQESVKKLRKKHHLDFKAAKESIRVYSQTVNGKVFYRLLYCTVDFDDFLALDCNDRTIKQDDEDSYLFATMTQFLFTKNFLGKITCIYDADYFGYRRFFASNGNHHTDGGYFFEFADLMIKPLNKSETGIFRTMVTRYFESERKDDGTIRITYPKFKGQLAASNKCDFVKISAGFKNHKVFVGGEYITIEASACLFDPKCPLKYSIQNAFDSDPATSYVENTKDDLMRITFNGFGKEFQNKTQINIINGYALNENLYKSNSRVKSLNAVGYKINDTNTELIQKEPIKLIFKDNILKNQKVSFDFYNRIGVFFFQVEEIFQGEKYSDTCIAEFNLSDNNNWFFGEINE